VLFVTGCADYGYDYTLIASVEEVVRTLKAFHTEYSDADRFSGGAYWGQSDVAAALVVPGEDGDNGTIG